MNMIAAFIGRVLLSIIFIVSGISKLFQPAATEAMITGAGLPAGLAIPTGVFELVAGLAIVLGFMTRFFAILLAGFCLVTILFFHREFTDPMQAAMAMKNLAIAGGLLCLFAHAQMRWSYDSMRLHRKAEIAERDAGAKVHEAELRASAAEAKAEGLRMAPAAVAPGAAVPAIDRNRDGVDDRAQRSAPSPRHDRDNDGIDDRDEPIDPRLRP